MYGIFTNICPKNHPKVVRYTSYMEHLSPGFPIEFVDLPRRTPRNVKGSFAHAPRSLLTPSDWRPSDAWHRRHEHQRIDGEMWRIQRAKYGLGMLSPSYPKCWKSDSRRKAPDLDLTSADAASGCPLLRMAEAWATAFPFHKIPAPRRDLNMTWAKVGKDVG